jgi:hypothetical protein
MFFFEEPYEPVLGGVAASNALAPQLGLTQDFPPFSLDVRIS